jgi:hypothetical protein
MEIFGSAVGHEDGLMARREISFKKNPMLSDGSTGVILLGIGRPRTISIEDCAGAAVACSK